MVSRIEPKSGAVWVRFEIALHTQGELEAESARILSLSEIILETTKREGLSTGRSRFGARQLELIGVPGTIDWPSESR